MEVSELLQTRNTREIHVSRELCNNEVIVCDESCEISKHISRIWEKTAVNIGTVNLNSARQNMKYS